MTAAIDLHCHLLPESGEPLRYLPLQFGTHEDPDQVLYRGASVGSIRPELMDPACAIRTMDRIGLEHRAMSIAPLSYRYDLPTKEGLRWHRGLNDALVAACAEHPSRLIPVGIVPLQDGEAAAEEATRAVRELGVKAIEIGTHVAGRNLDAPALEPFWNTIARIGVSLFIHPEHTASPRWGDYYLVNLVGNPVETATAVAALVFGGVIDRHPNLRCWLAHGGGALPWVIGRLQHGWSVRGEPRVNGSGSPLEILARNFWFDSLTHDVGILAALIGRFGADRVVVGSDAPFDMGDPDPLGTLAGAAPEARLRDEVTAAGHRLLELQPGFAE
jgi:aminocarboxymuconate-semialdehyde decarboxylase